MGFDRRMVVPRGMIRLLVQVVDEEVQVNFIIIDAYSPYTILARPWLYAMGAGIFNPTFENQVSHSWKSGRVGW